MLVVRTKFRRAPRHGDGMRHGAHSVLDAAAFWLRMAAILIGAWSGYGKAGKSSPRRDPGAAKAVVGRAADAGAGRTKAQRPQAGPLVHRKRLCHRGTDRRRAGA